MPRKRKALPPNYNDPLPTRLRDLLDKKDLTQQALADEIEVKRQTVSSYCDGSASPSLETLVRIAKFFETSTDYLLGLSDVASVDGNLQQACEYTGLSEDAVKWLASKKDDIGLRVGSKIGIMPATPTVLSLLIESSDPDHDMYGHFEEALRQFRLAISSEVEIQHEGQYLEGDNSLVRKAIEAGNAAKLSFITRDQAKTYHMFCASTAFLEAMNVILSSVKYHIIEMPDDNEKAPDK